jgi:hypothetical protein
MRVAANDDVNPARDWIELQCLDVVRDIDAAPAEGYHLGLRIADTFEGRWPHSSAVQSAAAKDEHMQIIASNEICLLSLAWHAS